MLNGDDHYAYIQGYSDGTVRPNANITRAQVATIFFRLLDEDVRDDNLTTYNTFPDVDQDYWANTAISTMASLGVINGRNSGLFDPDAYITRAEFAAICARFDDSGVDGITTFTDTVGHWAEDEISRAAALGWIQGYADGTFRPNQYITRAQAVTMINRVLCRLPEDTDDLLSGMNTWTDCHEDDWFYLAIQEATNSHDFVAKDRVYESWTDLNPAPDGTRYDSSDLYRPGGRGGGPPRPALFLFPAPRCPDFFAGFPPPGTCARDPRIFRGRACRPSAADAPRRGCVSFRPPQVPGRRDRCPRRAAAGRDRPSPKAPPGSPVPGRPGRRRPKAQKSPGVLPPAPAGPAAAHVCPCSSGQAVPYNQISAAGRSSGAPHRFLVSRGDRDRGR